MIFVPIDGLPTRGNEACGLTISAWHSYDEELEEFMRDGIRTARVSFDHGEFKSSKSAYGSLRQAVKRAGLPIDVFLRGGEVYIMRTDI